MTSEEYEKKFSCMDCPKSGGHTEIYMLRDAVWRSVVEGPGCLCIDCLETRLNRKLIILDFNSAPINLGIFKGYEIGREA